MGIKPIWLCLVLWGGLLSAQEVLRLEPKAPDGRTRFATLWYAPGQREVALALRGGSAKALAHIGVIQRFEEEGIPVDGITGTSGGAMMAGLMGAGYSPASLPGLFKSVDFGKPLDDRLRSPGRSLSEDEIRNSILFEMDLMHGKLDLLPGQERARRLRGFLWKLFGRTVLEQGTDFDRFRIPIRTVASDLQTGDAWVFRSGYLPDAVQASMTIPALLAPVEAGGHQLVDGGMVENLPLGISRKAFPGMLQVGVDIGRTWDASKVSNPGALMGRALDTSMRQTDLRSRLEADVLLNPDTDDANDFDFMLQVDKLVEAGRKSFDDQLPALEARIYGPQGAVLVAAALEVQGPAPVGLEPILKASLPGSGPLCRLDLYRVLRHLHASLPVRTATITLPATKEGVAVLRCELQTTIRRVDLTISPELPTPEAEAFRRFAERPGLKVGEPFDDHALDNLSRESAFTTTLISLQGTGFDAATGTLRLQVEPIRFKAVVVPPGPLQAPITELFAPVVGKPIVVEELRWRMDVIRTRFSCSSVEGQVKSSPEGVVLELTPKNESVLSMGVQLAYETTWGGHFGLDAKLRNPFGYGSTARFQGSFNSLQKQGTLSLALDSAAIPGFGGEALAYGFSENFGNKVQIPSLTFQATEDSTMHYQGAGIGVWKRFGTDEKAMSRLDLEYRKATSTLYGNYTPDQESEVAVASIEWDTLDYQLLPTSGQVLRLRGGTSLHTEEAQEPFQTFYGQYRSLFSLPGKLFSFDARAELGLGWQTPTDRYYIVGGSDSLIGSRSASYLLPNFGVISLALPFTSVSVMGIGIQVVPRADWARMAALPEQLSSGTRILGAGLIVRSVIRQFYVELAWGETQTRGENTNGTQKNNEISFLIGARPFDTWKHR